MCKQANECGLLALPYIKRALAPLPFFPPHPHNLNHQNLKITRDIRNVCFLWSPNIQALTECCVCFLWPPKTEVLPQMSRLAFRMTAYICTPIKNNMVVEHVVFGFFD
jgi:hypothetical protein